MATILNPTPQQGQGTFGAVPGQLGMPSPFGDLSSVYPNLSGTNSAVSGDILSKLSGNLSQDTINQIQNAAAQFGVSSGMPGSGLQWNKTLRDIGTTSEAQQQQGIQDYNATLPTVSSTQTVNPALQADISATNAVNAAAPNPAAAQTYAQQLFQQYLQSMQGPAGGSKSYVAPFNSGDYLRDWATNPRYGTA